MMSDITADRLAKVYIKMRDKRAEIKAAYEAEDAELKAQMEAIEAHLLEMCKTTGADSIRTPHGTIIRSVNTNYWPTDWSAMHKFIMERNMPELLQRRISQSVMKEYIENHPEDMPPGLNIDKKYVVNIRRSSK
jgi:hypothetical protein